MNWTVGFATFIISLIVLLCWIPLKQTPGIGTVLNALIVAIVIDFSKYLNSVIDFDKNNKKIITQPGITIDTLNNYLKPMNLLFTPDPSTTNRATVGGVIGNNSCGAHSVIYGKTIDHVNSLETILSNGNNHKFEKLSFNSFESLLNKGSLESNIYSNSLNLFKEYTDLVNQQSKELALISVTYY